jgi:hypothetical protein
VRSSVNGVGLVGESLGDRFPQGLLAGVAPSLARSISCREPEPPTCVFFMQNTHDRGGCHTLGRNSGSCARDRLASIPRDQSGALACSGSAFSGPWCDPRGFTVDQDEWTDTERRRRPNGTTAPSPDASRIHDDGPGTVAEAMKIPELPWENPPGTRAASRPTRPSHRGRRPSARQGHRPCR